MTITDGIAEVPLSDSVLALPDPQRSLLAAQIVYTLKQAGGVKGVVIKVNQQPYRVPGSDPNSLGDLGRRPFRVTSTRFRSWPANSCTRSTAVGSVKQVSTTNDSPTMSALPRPLGHGKYPVDALAVSVTNTDLAATTNGRTTLRPRTNCDRGRPARCSAEYRSAQTTVHQVWRDLGHRSRGWPATDVDVHRRQQQARSPSTHRCSRR